MKQNRYYIPIDIPSDYVNIFKKLYGINSKYQYKITYNETKNSLYIVIIQDSKDIIHLSLHSNKKKYDTSKIHIKFDKNPKEKEIDCTCSIKNSEIKLQTNYIDRTQEKTVKSLLVFFNYVLNML